MRKRKDIEGEENSESLDGLNDENRKLNYLKTVYGYLRLIDNYNLKEFFQLNDINNLNYLLDALISCIQFDYNSLNNFFEIEQNSSINAHKTIESRSNYEGLKTLLVNKVVIFQHVSLICSYLGRSNLVRLIIDQLLFNKAFCFQFNNEQNEILFIVDLLLTDICQNQYLNGEEIFSILNLILTHFLLDADHAISTSSAKSNFITSANQSIIRTCLKIELIRVASISCVTNENNRKFLNKFLIDTLYFLLENYLSKNLLVKVVCVKCLSELAVNLNFASIQDLLSQNFDYIMNDLILKINNSSKSQSDSLSTNTNILILCSLIDISNYEIIYYLNRLIDDLFFKCELSNSFTLLNGLCSIMLKMAKSMRKWYPVKMDSVFIERSEEEGSEENVEYNFNFAHIDFKKVALSKKVKDYNRPFAQVLKEIDQNRIEIDNGGSQMNMEDEDQSNQRSKDSETENDDIEGNTKKKEAPLHVKLQTKCLDKCQHLISNPDKQIRLRVIEIIRELCKNLAVDYENELLPLVHKLWSPIVQRFNFDDLIVKIRLVYLLFDLSVLCGDFLNSRFVKEFLKPRLCPFMLEQAKSSLTHDSTYIYTQIFKLQSSILTNIDKMCILFDVKEMDLEFIVETMVLSYLDKRQPKKLQSLAVEVLRNLSLIDSDIVWLCLHYVLPFESRQSYVGEDDNFKYSKFVPNRKNNFNLQFSDDVLKSLFELFRNI